MDFSLEYSKEQVAFAREVNEWLDKNVPKDLESPRDIRRMTREQYLKRRELGRKLGAKGWLYPGYPKEYGGGGMDMDHSYVLSQELGKRHLGIPPYYESGKLAAPAILASGTEEQKKRFLPPILKGEAATWQLFTEPEAGTDSANQHTSALHHVKEGNNFIINGGKIFVGGLYAPPEQFLLLTRSDATAPRHQNLAMFLAPANLPGITIIPLDLFPSGTFQQVSGGAVDIAPGVKHQVFFDDYKIPDSYLIGGDHEGWRVTNATLEVEHGGAAGTGGGGRAGTELSKNWVVETVLKQCKSNPGVRCRLAENPVLLGNMVNIFLGAEVERLFSIRNAWLAATGTRLPHAGQQLTLWAKNLGGRIITDIAEVLGPGALDSDPELGYESTIVEVVERGGVCFAPGGTPEALKIGISRALRVGR